jgi:hypothetical protein
MIHMFMVTSVFARPEKHGVFEGRRAKDQSRETHYPMSLKGPV